MSDYQGLVTKWRKKAKRLSTIIAFGEDRTLEKCADELAEVIARNVQPSPDADELRLDGIMASTPSGALDVIAPTYGGISRSNWPARPVQQPAPEPIAAFLEIARAHIAEGIPAFDEAFARAALALRDVPQGPQMEVFSKLIAKWEEVYDAFTLPFYKVTKKPDAMKGLRQCIEELKEAIAEARQVPVGPEGKKC